MPHSQTTTTTTTTTNNRQSWAELLLPGLPLPARFRPRPTVIDLTSDSPTHAQQQPRQQGGGVQQMQAPVFIDVEALPDRPLPTLHPPTQTRIDYNYNPHYDVGNALGGGRAEERAYRQGPMLRFGQQHQHQHLQQQYLNHHHHHAGVQRRSHQHQSPRRHQPHNLNAILQNSRVRTAPVFPPARSRGTFQPPGMINYEATALGFGPKETPKPFEETYVEPPKARPGFTRSPTEDDVLVCAKDDCDQELGEAEDENDEKGLVYVGKCGHVSTHSSIPLYGD